MSDFIVGLEQKFPFEYVLVEIFTEQTEALDYAEKHAQGHGFIQLSKRTWRSSDNDKIRLTVRRR